MKKLICLSAAVFAFAFQSSVYANASTDELVRGFCEEAKTSNLSTKDEIADMVRTYMAELEEPTMDQIIALSQIAIKVEMGYSLKSACSK